MELILARHGNTFLSNDPVVWVGSKNDLPLVASGIDQAKKLGKNLLKANWMPTAVYTGPLQRMTGFAEHILNEMQSDLPIQIDNRLNEIDYGKWSGLTKEMICKNFSQEEFEEWELYSRWPKEAAFGESFNLVSDRIKQFANNLLDKHQDTARILVVASNGCLRFFLNLIPNLFKQKIADQSIKMGTGKIGKINYESSSWKLIFWNEESL